MNQTFIAVRLGIENLREIAFGDISGDFVAVGDPVENGVHSFLIQNTTDVEIAFSDDGINNKFVLTAGQAFVYDIQSNRANLASGIVLDKGSVLYARQKDGAPTSGNIYFTAFYASDR